MDPLTHTLVGANLAGTRLGERTRLATAALVIGANLPDVDAILYFTGHRDLALDFRRGWTHGVLALFVLPFLQTALLLAWDRMRPDPQRRALPGQLLLISTIAILTHPALDWLNNYGLRWLMPFRGTWYYGDSVYIMDPLLWTVLGGLWLAGRRPTKTLVAILVIVFALLVWIVAGRATAYLPVIAAVAMLMLAALWWRPRASLRSLSAAALILGTAYIGARLTIHELTERAVAREVPGTERMMVSPRPIDPLTWDVVLQVPEVYRFGEYSWWDRQLRLASDRIPRPAESPEWQAARSDPGVRGFVGWARFPWYEVERLPQETRVHLYDARYMTRRTRGFGGVVVTLPAADASR
jgi:inner membrane protein